MEEKFYPSRPKLITKFLHINLVFGLVWLMVLRCKNTDVVQTNSENFNADLGALRNGKRIEKRDKMYNQIKSLVLTFVLTR